MDDFPPELLELARGPVGFPPTREIATITDDDVDGVPIRIYRATVRRRGSSCTSTAAATSSAASG